MQELHRIDPISKVIRLVHKVVIRVNARPFPRLHPIDWEKNAQNRIIRAAGLRVCLNEAVAFGTATKVEVEAVGRPVDVHAVDVPTFCFECLWGFAVNMSVLIGLWFDRREVGRESIYQTLSAYWVKRVCRYRFSRSGVGFAMVVMARRVGTESVVRYIIVASYWV